MPVLKLLRAHGRLIGFGALLCFCSTMGQTYFISLFGGVLRSEFALSHGGFGTLYMLGTMASAATLVWLGRLVDRWSMAAVAAAALGGLAAVCLGMSLVGGVVALTLAIYGLRLFGQGLVSHAAITAMARGFHAERGQAISLASLGYTGGAALAPGLVVAAFAVLSWREVWGAAALFLLAVLPLVPVLLRHYGARLAAVDVERGGAMRQRDWTLAQVLRDRGLWLRVPALLAPSFLGTGFIFHQVHLAQAKGWPLSLLAGSFTVYAACSVAAMLLGGLLVDRLTARRLVPVFLAPLTLACLTLAASDARPAATAFLALLGTGGGLTAVLLGAVWAELYGLAHLGAIRAFTQAMMVLSTGLAPAVMGVAVDAGASMEAIAAAGAAWCVAASALAGMAGRTRLAAARRRAG